MRPVIAALFTVATLASCASRPQHASGAATAAPEAAHADDVSQASRTGWTDKDRAAKRESDAIRKAPIAAVLRVTRVDDECSNAGGTHLTLEAVTVVKGRKPTSVAAGGHAIWITAKVGDLFIAGVAPPASPKRAENAGWCLSGLPAVDGYATVLVKTGSEAAGEARLREILQSTP